ARRQGGVVAARALVGRRLDPQEPVGGRERSEPRGERGGVEARRRRLGEQADDDAVERRVAERGRRLVQVLGEELERVAREERTAGARAGEQGGERVEGARV